MFNDQVNEFDINKLTDLDCITVNRNPISDNKVANEIYIDDDIGNGTLDRCNQTLEKLLYVSVGVSVYNLTKFNWEVITDTSVIKAGSSGGYLLQQGTIERKDKHNTGRTTIFIRSTKTNSPAPDSEATSVSPLGGTFMYKESS